MSHILVYRDVPYSNLRRCELTIDGRNFHLVTEALPAEGGQVRSEASADFDEMRRRPEADGFDRWVYPVEGGVLGSAFNVHAATAEEKVPPYMYAARINKFLFAHVVIRPEDESFEDCVYLIQGAPQMEFVCNRPFVIRERVFTSGRHTYWPEMELLAPEQTTGPCAVEVRMHPRAHCDVYPKCDTGHVPRKVRVDGGRGSFVFTPIGMQAGEFAEIKVGFAHFSNVASARIAKAPTIGESLWRSFILSGRQP